MKNRRKVAKVGDLMIQVTWRSIHRKEWCVFSVGEWEGGVWWEGLKANYLYVF